MMLIRKLKPLAFTFAVSALFIVSCASSSGAAENKSEFEIRTQAEYKRINMSVFFDSMNHARYGYPNSIPPWDLYKETQIAGIAENMLYLQNPDGGWAKNYDWQRIYTLSELENIKRSLKSVPAVTYELDKSVSNRSTMDNRNIIPQIDYLYKVYEQIPDQRYIDCIERAVNWLLNAQHPVSGGFTGSDVYAVTYNDKVMTDAVGMLRDIAAGKYPVLSEDIQKKAAEGYRRGIECILKTQIKVTLPDGTELLTAWCQQHSHETYEPVWARTFEPPSITAGESCDVVRLLMADPEPTEEMKTAIKAACDWLFSDEILIHDKKVVKHSHKGVVLNGRYSDYENRLEDYPGNNLWARFYSLGMDYEGTYIPLMEPVWCDRDRKICASYNDMSMERRNGYGYVGTWPRKLLSEYNAWKSRRNIRGE